jgi:hypothetical protein
MDHAVDGVPLLFSERLKDTRKMCFILWVQVTPDAFGNQRLL